MAVKYDYKTNSELQRVVRNYNAKIKRLEKSGKDLKLPESESIKAIKSRVTNKWELNRELATMMRFTERNAEEYMTTKAGVKIPRYEYQNLLSEQKRLSSKLYRQIKATEALSPTEFGIPEPITLKQLPSSTLSNLRARREAIQKPKITNLQNEELKMFNKLITMTRQHERYLASVYMDNMINDMIVKLGYFVGYNMNKIEEIKEKLLTLNERQFLKLMKTEGIMQKIKDYYPDIHKSVSYNQAEITELFDKLYENVDTIVEQIKTPKSKQQKSESNK